MHPLGYLVVMDGLTQSEYVHSTASELLGPRVNLSFRWISEHTKPCPRAGLIGCALPLDAQHLVEPHSLWLLVEEVEMPMTCLMVLLVFMGACFLWKYEFVNT